MNHITATILAKVDEPRLVRAAASLRKGEYTVSLTRVDSAAVTAFVANGKGQSYTVSLTETGGFCSCPDYAFRNATCKHQVALAVRLVQDGVTIPDAPSPDIALAKTRPGWHFAA